MDNQELSSVTPFQFPADSLIDTKEDMKRKVQENNQAFLQMCDKLLFHKTWEYPSDKIVVSDMLSFLRHGKPHIAYPADLYLVAKILADRGWVVAVNSIRGVPLAISIYHPKQVGKIRRFFCWLSRITIDF